MASNVISFRRRTEGERPPTQPVTQEGRARFAHERLAEIKSRMEQVPVIPSKQRVRVANNLWEILSELESASQPISKRKVLHAAGKGGEGDSTKRLPHYALDPTLPEAEQKRRASRLTQKIRKYVEIAHAAARLTQRDDDHFISALVEGTQYAILRHPSKTTSNEEVAAEAWREIAATIIESSRRIEKRYGLKEVFEKITFAGIYFDGLRFGEARTETFWSTQNMPRPALVSDGEVVPCPSLFLDTIAAGERLPCELHQNGIGLFSDGDGHLEEVRDAMIEAGFDTFSVRAYAEPVLRVYLELLPHGKDGAVTPSLRLYPTLNFVLAEDFDPCGQVKIDEERYTANRLKAGEWVADTWRSVQDTIHIDDMHNIEWLVITKEAVLPGIHDFLHRESLLSVHFDEAVVEDYRSSLHARIPESGSLILSLDEAALEHLNEQLSSGRASLPFCWCIEHRLNESKTEVKRSESIVGDSTLLAALDRSLSDELGLFRLDKLLEQEVNAFLERSNEALERYTVKMEAKDEQTSAALRGLRDRRARFAAEYKT